MTPSRKAPPADAFFLPAERGERFCLFHPPAPSVEPKGAFIYVHPFCEEMNCSRRMAALQSRALADLGYGVLQIDLYGCGDSSGDFADARWQIWKSDLALAWQWLETRLGLPVALWGLRLGALLALDYAADATLPVGRILLWHPVINGEAYLSQFWRLKLASRMLDGEESPSQANSIKAALVEGRHVEVAGYSVAAEMVSVIEKLRLGGLVFPGVRVDWFDLASRTDVAPAPAIARAVDGWKNAGADLHLHLLQGPPFWSSPESGVSQALLGATTRLFAGSPE